MRLFYGLSGLALIVLFSNSFKFIFAHSPTDSLGRVALFTKLPLLVFLFSTESNAAGVWIPEEPALETDGTVLDEFSEVSHVFAKPENKVIKKEDVESEQVTPWTSLKQEMELYNKYHKNGQVKKKAQNEDSSEDSDEEEEEEDEEEKNDELPQAFYGQQNADDDEKEHFLNQKKIYKKTKKVTKLKEDSEEDDDVLDNYSDDLKLDDIPPNVKDAMLTKLLASRKSGKDSESEEEEEEEDQPESDLSDDISEDEAEKTIEKSSNRDEEDLQDEGDDRGGGGKGKSKGKGKKKKKGKKGGGGGSGWGWKPKPIYIPIEPPGWGWKKDHDGILEQAVKGSTWGRILDYYHHSRDQKKKEHPGWGWKEADLGTKVHVTGEGLADKLFKGSFWERAVQTYGQYKKNSKGKPTKEIGHSGPGISMGW